MLQEYKEAHFNQKAKDWGTYFQGRDQYLKDRGILKGFYLYDYNSHTKKQAKSTFGSPFSCCL